MKDLQGDSNRGEGIGTVLKRKLPDKLDLVGSVGAEPVDCNDALRACSGHVLDVDPIHVGSESGSRNGGWSGEG
jgi:hypothetical protein